MSCVLCLKPSVDAAENIEILSIEGQELQIQSIIEQHFSWLRYDANNESTSKKICYKCWKVVSTFHDFYLQIENAYKCLESKTNPMETVLVEPHVMVAFSEMEHDQKDDVLNIMDIKVEPEEIEEPLLKPLRKYVGAKYKRKIKSSNKGRTRKKETNVDDLEDVIVDPKYLYPLTEVKADTTNTSLLSLNTTKIEVDQDNSLQKQVQEQQPGVVESTESTNRTCVNFTSLNSRSKMAGQERDAYVASHLELSCYICDVPLKNFAKLQMHFQDEHQTRGYVFCCGKKIYKRCELVDHLRTHENPSIYKCPHCDKVLGSHDYLQHHIKNCKQLRERKFECEICSKKFYIRKTYERHKLIHLPDKEKTVPCPECEKTFATKYTMNEHLKSVHLNAYAKVCNVCGKSVVGRAALRRHLDEHSGVPAPIIQCNECGITLTTKDGLKRHIKVIHIEENRKPQTCPICSKVLSSLRAYANHINYAHKLEPKHACTICGRAFKRQLHLKEHMTIHTGEMLYTCPYCPKTFRANARMYCHIKAAHPKEFEEKQMARNNKNCAETK